MKRGGLLANLRTGIQPVSDMLDRICKWICVALILFMAVEVITAVFFRYVLFAPFRWGEELARLVMIWIGMLGIAIALKDGEHIGRWRTYRHRNSGEPVRQAFARLVQAYLPPVRLYFSGHIILLWISSGPQCMEYNLARPVDPMDLAQVGRSLRRRGATHPSRPDDSG
ncbi:MAG: TRAP transporter small permease subunit [Deltaproteobacteria bacterium]|nr:TRAP transporter small permease subunit [Deltaproteobacteria bacterium]